MVRVRGKKALDVLLDWAGLGSSVKEKNLGRPKKTIGEIIKKDLIINNLPIEICKTITY